MSGISTISLYYRYSTDNSSWGGWTFFGTDYAYPYSLSFTAPLGDGYYEFYSIAVDGAGNGESPPTAADASCGVDKFAPTSSVNTISPYWQTSTSFQITVTASDAMIGVENVSLYYRYSTDNSNWSTWAVYDTDNTAPGVWSITAPSGSGYYEFYSIAQDKVTNVESAPTAADARCGVDITAPPAPSKSSPASWMVTDDNQLTFTWTATTDDISGIANYELWIDNNSDFSSPEVLENTADNMTLSLISTALAEGNYSWRIRAWDCAGNASNFETPWMFLIGDIIRNVNVTILPGENIAELGSDLTFTVIVTNMGNIVDNYNLMVDGGDGWGVTISENFLMIQPGESREVVVKITIPSDAVSGNSKIITVTAISVENVQIASSATYTAMTAETKSSIDFVPIVVGGALVGGGAAVALMLKRMIFTFRS